MGDAGGGRARALVVAAVAVALILGAAGAVLAWRGYESARQDETRRIEAGAVANAGDIAQFIRARTQILDALASSDSFISGDGASVTRRLTRLNSAALGFPNGLAWFDADGVVRGENGTGLRTGARADGGLAAVLARVRSEGLGRLSPALPSSLYPTPVVLVIAPTRGRDAQVNGTLVGALSVAWLNAFSRERQRLRDGDAIVVDREGTLFVAPGLVRPRSVAGDPLLRRARQPGRDSASARGVLTDVRNVLGQDDRVNGYATDDEVTGWTVFVDRSTAAAFADARRTLAIELALLGLLVALGIAGAVVLWRRAEAERRAAGAAALRTRRLQEMAAALSAAATPSEVADAVLELGRSATGADAGTVALLDPDRGSLRTVAIAGYSDAVTDAFGSYAADAALPIPESLREGPLWLRSATDVRRRYPQLESFQATVEHEAVAAVPLRVEGVALGGMALSFPETRAFDPDERTFLLTVADLCAQALDRARLYESQRRAAERDHFLAEASTLLAAPLEPRAALTSLTRLAVPVLADWCSVTMVAEGGLETVAVAHADPAREAGARELADLVPPAAGDASGVGAVIRTGRSELVPEITGAMIEEAVPPGERREALLALGLVSAMTVPLTARGRTLGAVVLASGDSGRRFDADDLRFAEDLGRRAGLVVDNAILYRRTRQVARTLQNSLLPATLPRAPGLDVAARYVAGGQGVDVGGDFYDLFALRNGAGWFAVLGDVCGKGPEAAALTALARYTIRADADARPPAAVLERLNAAVLAQVGDMRFLTALVARLRPGDDGVAGSLARGGHPPALLARAGGDVELLLPDGPLVGVLESTHYAELPFHLRPGDALVLFSDGVSEARGPEGELFGVERLADVVAANAGSDAEGIARAIGDAVEEFGPDGPQDDVALLVVRAAGADGPVRAAAAP